MLSQRFRRVCWIFQVFGFSRFMQVVGICKLYRDIWVLAKFRATLAQHKIHRRFLPSSRVGNL